MRLLPLAMHNRRQQQLEEIRHSRHRHHQVRNATWQDLAAMVFWTQLIGLVASEEESSSSSSSKPEDEDSGGKPLSTEAIIGIVAGIATIIATIIAAYMCCCRG